MILEDIYISFKRWERIITKLSVLCINFLNAFIEPNWLVGSPMYIKKLYLASHELFHIMYQELVWNKENKPRIVWFDEGMA